jgi:hypothetical protein
MPNLTTEYFGGGDTTWMGSLHGLESARSIVLKKAAFTQNTHYKDGFIPSGTALAKGTDGLYGPYGAAPYNVLAGFLATDKKCDAFTDPKIAAPLLDHGRVKVAKLPFQPFTVPTGANNATTIIFD